jgi:hypothetical protein
MDLNDIVKPQDIALTKIATIFPNEKSIKKQPYVNDKSFRGKDIIKLFSSIGRLINLIGSLITILRLKLSYLSDLQQNN